MKDTLVDISIPKFFVLSEKNIASFKQNKEFYKLAASEFPEISGKPDFTASHSMIMNTFELNEEGILFQSYSFEAGTGRDIKARTSFVCSGPFLFFVFPKKENLALLAGVIDQL
ncbi:hypothetical protein B4U80_12906 [Leptotrombidium deliense]|uniref:Serpin domain-containing protein n=1 Tax=Leptotrombidium deliense TaxID=299467 RepID=A0A443SHN6_9ACAR|nr:hypothetical protein B4U80_12906 [Leptotrombidium deliense]